MPKDSAIVVDSSGSETETTAKSAVPNKKSQRKPNGDRRNPFSNLSNREGGEEFGGQFAG